MVVFFFGKNSFQSDFCRCPLITRDRCLFFLRCPSILQILLYGSRSFMDSRSSPGLFLAYLMAKKGLTVKSLCMKSGLNEHEVRALLDEHKIITPAIAEKLGSVFYSPRFWIIRQALWQLQCDGLIKSENSVSLKQ